MAYLRCGDVLKVAIHCDAYVAHVRLLRKVALLNGRQRIPIPHHLVPCTPPASQAPLMAMRGRYQLSTPPLVPQKENVLRREQGCPADTSLQKESTTVWAVQLDSKGSDVGSFHHTNTFTVQRVGPPLRSVMA